MNNDRYQVVVNQLRELHHNVIHIRLANIEAKRAEEFETSPPESVQQARCKFAELWQVAVQLNPLLASREVPQI